MTQRWKITIEYDGTPFFGWQKQPEAIGVQSAIEDAIEEFSQEKVEVYGSGRTDTGVHALGQVAHFDLEREMEEYKMCDAINHFLKPLPVAIIKAEKVDSEFHARFGAKQRSYIYKILNRQAPSVIDRNRVWHYITKLDEKAMQEAANLLVGKHDFSTFRASGCQSESPVKTLDSIKLWREDEYVYMEVSARSFMYHQVRNIIGTLVLVGDNRWSIEDFKEAFEAKDRSRGGVTAPACGLYFKEIKFD